MSARGNAVTALAASPWAPLIAVSGHKQVVLYNMDDLTVAGTRDAPTMTLLNKASEEATSKDIATSGIANR